MSELKKIDTLKSGVLRNDVHYKVGEWHPPFCVGARLAIRQRVEGSLAVAASQFSISPWPREEGSDALVSSPGVVRYSAFYNTST